MIISFRIKGRNVSETVEFVNYLCSAVVYCTVHNKMAQQKISDIEIAVVYES